MRESARVSIHVSETSDPPGTPSTKVLSNVALWASTGRPPTNREGGDGVTGARSVADVGVGYARELGDLGGDGPAGMHEGLEALPDLAAAEQRRGDLYEVAVLEGEARRLGVEHHDLVLEGTEVERASALGQAYVGIPDHVGGAGKEYGLHLGGDVRHASSAFFSPAWCASSAYSTKRAQSSGNSMPP